MSQQTNAVPTTAVDNSQSQDVYKSKDIPIIPSIAQIMRIPISFSNLKTHALIDTGAAASFLAHRLLIEIPYKDIREVTGPNKIEQLFKTASGELVRPIGRYELHIVAIIWKPFSYL